ncbi:properdin-like [Trachinotus anak]|uniref:properdin-like n=1 Tax=Trachinotus anak TaxID=443729 RepID=UPI0039F1BB6C
MKVLQVLVLLLVSVGCSECVRCFARFDRTSGQCDEELGEVDEDDCCQNLQYGYQATDGVCQSCGHPAWSSWSPWSQCNVLCGEGVRQRSRTCFGIGQPECNNAADNLQMEPCTSTCCGAKGWDLWLPWSPCSVTCGEGGVRKRKRVCSTPECRLACSGSSEETENCPPHTCPVQGVWSSWSSWSKCSASCIDEQSSDVPSKVRYHSCSNPTHSCPGDDFQMTNCSDLPNCPVDGNWGEWSPFGPCSVSCGEGLQLSIRNCNRPASKYGGRFCDGPSTRSNICQSPCPVDGFWTGWSSWSECSSSCIPQNQASIRSRHRFCSNPAPSSIPRGKQCQGENQQTENCNFLPHCPVDGEWGSWSPFTSCPVTCGVGLQVSVRRCDSPAPVHGGRPCPGEGRQTSICTTKVHCPVNGVWSEWSPWSQCKFPTGSKSITCKRHGGSQFQERQCLHQAHGGAICEEDRLTKRQVCYDVHNCPLKGKWEGWERWSYCEPPCGENSRRSRKRYCKPDYSGYSPTIGRQREKATFSGTPRVACGPLPDGEEESQTQPCLNAPPCPVQP